MEGNRRIPLRPALPEASGLGGWSCIALSLLAGVLSLAASGRAWSAPGAEESSARKHSYYRKHLRVPLSLEPILRHLEAGHDAFPEEKVTAELAQRLSDLGRALRGGRLPSTLEDLLAPDFEGAGLVPPQEAASSASPAFEVLRSKVLSTGLRNRESFARELGALLGELEQVEVAEFLITRIEAEKEGLTATEVCYDLVGRGEKVWRGERVGRWRMQWRRSGAGRWQVVRWAPLEATRSNATVPVFTETTEAALGGNPSFTRQLAHGLDDWLATLDAAFMHDSMGHHGVSAGDADGDGRDDLYVAQPAGLPNRLFRNRGDGTLEDVTETAGLDVLDETSHSLFADVDNDGDQDLVLVASVGLLLFRNDGAGRFAVVPDAFKLAPRGTPMAMAMADYDRDGDLDLYLCTYSYFIGASEDKGGSPSPYHDAQNGPPNVLFRNDGRGRFVEATEEAGLAAGNNRFSFAAAFGDYDDDGWPDLLVANDFGRKNLYHNEGLRDGKVTFKEVTVEAGLSDHGAGMSAAFLDYDNDGRLDIYTGNMWSASGRRITALPGFKPDAPAEIRALYARHARGNSLFRNRGDGTFDDVTETARAERGRWAWSSDVLDFDNDGFEDLYVVNGMFTRNLRDDDFDLDPFFWRQVAARSPLTRATGTPYDDAWRAINRLLADRSQAAHQRNVFLRNDGQGGFDEVSGTVGLDLDQDGRAFAVADLDGDGDSDLAVMAARGAPQLRIFRNDFADRGAALAVRLSGTRGNRDAVGARVTVETEKLRRTKELQAGSGFISQHAKELLFGLGRSERILKLSVRWPGGEAQVFTEVPLNQRVRVEEGNAALRAEAFGSPAPSGATSAAAETVASLPSASWLYEPYPAPDFTVKDLQGQPRSLASLRGRPALLLFWRTDVAPARAALRELANHAEDLTRAGAQVLAVSLDSEEDVAKVRAAARGLPVGVPVAFGTDAVGAVYTLLNRYLFVTKADLRLPTAFLLSAHGEIVRVYRDPVRAALVLADLPRIEAVASERRERAMAFPGKLYSTPGQRNAAQYGLELVEQGFEDAALAAFERAAKGDPNAFTLYSLGTLYMKSGQNGKAGSAFTRALEVKPDFAEASNGLGALLAQGGNLPAAIARFKVALEATPEYPDALNNLGYAFLQQGDGARARDLIQKALALQPDFPEAFNNLGIYYARQGDPVHTEEAFRRAVEKRPGYGEAGNNLALVLMAREDVAGAIAVLERLVRESPEFETTYVTLSRIYLSTGRSREGMQVLERLLQRNPNHPVAQQMVKELRASP